MVITLVAILSAVAIPQFLDFRTEAKDAATLAALGAMRTGLSNQKGNMILRCNSAPGSWPSIASVTANSVITGGDCTALQVVNSDEAKFVSESTMPGNPWGVAKSTTVVACSGAGCNNAGTDCAGAAYTAASDGWCYKPATGEFWANSNNSTGPIKEHLF